MRLVTCMCSQLKKKLATTLHLWEGVCIFCASNSLTAHACSSLTYVPLLAMGTSQSVKAIQILSQYLHLDLFRGMVSTYDVSGIWETKILNGINENGINES